LIVVENVEIVEKQYWNTLNTLNNLNILNK